MKDNKADDVKGSTIEIGYNMILFFKQNQNCHSFLFQIFGVSLEVELLALFNIDFKIS